MFTKIFLSFCTEFLDDALNLQGLHSLHILCKRIWGLDIKLKAQSKHSWKKSITKMFIRRVVLCHVCTSSQANLSHGEPLNSRDVHWIGQSLHYSCAHLTSNLDLRYQPSQGTYIPKNQGRRSNGSNGRVRKDKKTHIPTNGRQRYQAYYLPASRSINIQVSTCHFLPLRGWKFTFLHTSHSKRLLLKIPFFWHACRKCHFTPLGGKNRHGEIYFLSNYSHFGMTFKGRLRVLHYREARSKISAHLSF